jgi:hypothetical protein
MASRLLSGSAIAGVTVLGACSFRRWHLGFGATADERADSFPGDELLPTPDLVATRAIGIAAAPEGVWPWLVQMGQGRGGFYSYDRLENLVGCDLHSATTVVPEWQQLVVGDEVRLTPDVPLRVAVVDPPHALVLSGGVDVGDTPAPYAFTWTFAVVDAGEGSSRLVVRERYTYLRRWAPLLVEPVEAVSFVMSQKMLRGIRDRAEGRLT